MKPIQQHLTEMNARLKSVESAFQSLRGEVRETNERLQGEIERHAAATREEFERHAEVTREVFERHVTALRGEFESHTAALQGETERSAQAMQRELSRNTAVFDQFGAQVVDELQRYQGAVGKVVGFLVEENAQHHAEHDELFRRVEALERRLAG